MHLWSVGRTGGLATARTVRSLEPPAKRVRFNDFSQTRILSHASSRSDPLQSGGDNGNSRYKAIDSSREPEKVITSRNIGAQRPHPPSVGVSHSQSRGILPPDPFYTQQSTPAYDTRNSAVEQSGPMEPNGHFVVERVGPPLKANGTVVGAFLSSHGLGHLAEFFFAEKFETEDDLEILIEGLKGENELAELRLRLQDANLLGTTLRDWWAIKKALCIS